MVSLAPFSTSCVSYLTKDLCVDFKPTIVCGGVGMFGEKKEGF